MEELHVGRNCCDCGGQPGSHLLWASGAALHVRDHVHLSWAGGCSLQEPVMFAGTQLLVNSFTNQLTSSKQTIEH